jgi:hypothetical protein
MTGSTIDNTSIGATTPSTVNATTITGQTARLNGTGQNLLQQSNTFTNVYWNKPSATGGQTDPFGGSTAALVTYTAQFQTLSPFIFLTNGITYTFSIWCYVSSGTRTFACGDVSGSVYGSFTATTTWTRYSVTFTATTSSQFIAVQDRNASGFPVNVYFYGAQLEVGNAVNTYIPTTTTGVYGTPTLSFSGVSTIGLESNGALFVQPAGTGALQAQATTSTTAGGNARGSWSVDWQLTRASAAQVASGVVAVVAGGGQNTASNFYATVSGGQANNASNLHSVISGGLSNTASGQYSVISGGASHTAAGIYNFIGGGFTNSGTANAAVTTQSGTMNGTTAVTLSGSNASIRVGQYISGTSIATDTYVAAISGTSLTLSKNASGSSTSTLSC